MSIELISVLIAVLAIGVTQSGLILTSNRGLRGDMAQLEHGQAKLEGLLEGLREAITVRTASADELAGLVTQLCNPDPQLRGHPKNIGYRGDRYSLERYVSIFDRLAKKAEWSLTRRDSIMRST